jgi:diguanylate cyclase (GGDEF)-like protein/putative nucleotidyltransferase with HDIG domain
VPHAVRAGGDLQPVLEAIARVISASVGFGTVVINLYRPAWDDFEVVVVHGSEDARHLLLGETTTWTSWQGLLDPRFERQGAFMILRGEYDWDRDGSVSYVPPAAGEQGPDAWDPEDALMVPLRASSGELLGVVSVDEPLDGRRPSEDRLEVLSALVAHASIAVEHAQATAESERHRAAVEYLLRVSAQLTGRGTAAEMLDAVCMGIREGLGFQRVMVALTEGPDRRLVIHASAGWAPEEIAELPPVPLGSIAPLLRSEHQREGCVLLSRDEAEALTASELRRLPPSSYNGRGPRGWRRHWLIVPLHDRDGGFSGIVWVDDPVDRLLPTTERLQALRAFANQAISAVESARQVEHLRHVAQHDPLTGLRNRRDFEPRLDADLRANPDVVSVLVCDLDHFKQINDSLGHDAGDDVLRRFAEILRRCTRGSDVPTRLGGEEFAVVLPRAGASAALAVGERLRRAVQAEFADFPLPVSVSVGVAATGVEVETAAQLLRAGSRAMYAAKRLGRDRCVTYHRETLGLLDSLREEGAEAGDQLVPAMLLAETLDLRDVGTARHSETVGRLAEQIARELGWEPARVDRLRAAGVLHDVGKLGISDAILYKPAALDPDEWEEIKRHPEIGARILEHANLRDIGAWVLAHHERLDGRGYPRGLSGDDIPVEARVLAVADAYEAMTADRPYRGSLGPEEAAAELRRGAGTQFDADVVDALLRTLSS